MENRSQKPETLPELTDYHLSWVRNIKPQSYLIRENELREFSKCPNFKEPEKFKQSAFENFDCYNTELKQITGKLKEWNGKGLVCLMSKNTGIGKTHLAIATAREYFRKQIYNWIESNKTRDFGYKDYAQQEYFEMIERNTPLYFSENELYKQDYGNLQFNFWIKINRVVVIDDLFAGKQNETSRGAIYELINTRITNYNLPTVISTNLTLEKIGQIDERIASRLQGAYTFELNSDKDYR